MALIACFGLFSCSSIGYLSMDSLYPAELSFPHDIKAVGIVDNAANHDTLRAAGITVGTIEGNGKIMAQQLANYIADGEYFDEVILCDSSLRSGNTVDAEAKLSPETVQALAADLGVDMLVSIDGVCLKTWPALQYYWDFPEPFEVIAGEVSSVLSIYAPSRKEPVHPALVVRDTLCWNLHDSHLTERRIVEDASAYAASLSVKYLIPQWKAEERFYYSGGDVAMRDAAVYVQENRWDEAFQLWKQEYDASKAQSKKRMRAALNIALYYEMQGNIPEALKYAQEAMETAKPESTDKKLITFYHSGQLTGKSIKVQKLNLQMERFKEK